MRDLGSLAVHHALGANHVSPVRLTDCLVAQADAEDRDGRSPVSNRFDAHAGLFGRARSGRQHDRRWRELANLVDADRVIPSHDDFRAQFAEILDEVVREGVVVVDHEKHGGRLEGGGRGS